MDESALMDCPLAPCLYRLVVDRVKIDRGFERDREERWKGAMMKWLNGDEPACSHLLSTELAEGFIRSFLQRARLANSLAENFRDQDLEGSQEWRSMAERSRDLAWLIRPGDRIWITVDEGA